MSMQKEQPSQIYYRVRAKNRQFSNLQSALYKCEMIFHKISRMVIFKEKEKRRQIYDHYEMSQYQGNQINILFNNTQTTQLEMQDIVSQLQILNLSGIAQIFKYITKMLYSISDDFTNIFKEIIQRSKEQYSWRYSKNLCARCAKNIQRDLLEEMKRSTTIGIIDDQQMRNKIVNQFKNYQEDQLFMVEKQHFLSQIDQILKNKNNLLDRSHTKTYKFLMKTILEKKKTNDTSISNPNQKILENISLRKFQILSQGNNSYENMIELLKNQLFNQFLQNLSGPFRALLERVHSKQIKNNKITKTKIIAKQIQTFDQTTQTNITPQSIQIVYLEKDIQRKKQQIKALRDSKSYIEKNYIKTLQRQKKTQIQLYHLKANNTLAQKSFLDKENKQNYLTQKIKHIKQEHQIQKQSLTKSYLADKNNIIKYQKQIQKPIELQPRMFSNISIQTEAFQGKNEQKQKIVQSQNTKILNPLKKNILMIGKPVKIKQKKLRHNSMNYSRQISLVLNQPLKLSQLQQLQQEKINYSISSSNEDQEKQYKQIHKQKKQVRYQQKQQIKKQNKTQKKHSKKVILKEKENVRNTFAQVNTVKKHQNQILNQSQRLQNNIHQKMNNHKQITKLKQLEKSLTKNNDKVYVNKILRNYKNQVQDRIKVKKILEYMKSHRYNSQESWKEQNNLQTQMLKNSAKDIIKSYKDVESQKQFFLHQQNEIKQVENNKQLLIQKIQNTKQIIQKQYSYFMAIGMIKFIDDIGLNMYKTLKFNGKVMKNIQSKENNIKLKDLQLFGGQKSACNYQNKVGQWKSIIKSQQKLIFDLKNTSFAEKISKFFVLLEKIDKKKYQEYLLFLIYPTKILNAQKKFNQAQYKKIKSNKHFIKKTFLTLINYHKFYHKQCTHLIQFLYKIGYYKYIF